MYVCLCHSKYQSRCFTYIIFMHHTNNEQSLIIIHGILESQCLPFMFASFQSTMLSVWHYSCIILRSSFFRIEFFFSTLSHTIPKREYPFVFFRRTFTVVHLCCLFCFYFGAGGLWSIFRKWSWIAFQFADLMIWGILVHRVSGIITDFKLHSKYVCQGT